MSQQVNLFEPGLVKSKDWFTLSFVAGVYVLAVMAMLYFYSSLVSENAQLQTQRSQALAQSDAMQKKVDEFAQRLVPVDNSKLEAELKGLKARLEMQTQILAIFQQSISENAWHLIDYMRALTGQQQPDLWLTGFKIEPAFQHVSLSGQSLQAEDIPLYLDLLSAQKVFAGTQFSGLQFKQVELHKPQQAAPVADVAAAPAPPPVATAATKAPAPADNETMDTDNDKETADAMPPAAVAAPSPAPASASPSVSTAAPAAITASPAMDTLKVYAFDVKGREANDRNKPVSSVSWDDFVRQTVQQPKALPAQVEQNPVKQP